MTITIRTGYQLSYDCTQPTPMILCIGRAPKPLVGPPVQMLGYLLGTAIARPTAFWIWLVDIRQGAKGPAAGAGHCDLIRDHIAFGYEHANRLRTTPSRGSETYAASLRISPSTDA